MTNSSCPVGETPEDLPISNSLTYVVVPSQTAPDKWMTECCGSNPVHVIDTCWEWCEVSGKDSESISSTFGHCIMVNGRNLTTSNGLLTHIGTGAHSGAATYDAFTGSSLVLGVLLLSLLKPFF